jgi:dTDP-D-glucose 4,6-dehydratase
VFEHSEWRPGDQRYYVSDPSKFHAATGWWPKVGLESGLAALHDWLRTSNAPLQLRAQPRRRWRQPFAPGSASAISIAGDA